MVYCHAQCNNESNKLSFSGRNWLEFSATVGEAERLLNTKYYSFKHKESDGTRIASDEYSLPADIQKHVDFVMPTVQLDGLKPTPKSAMVIEAPSPITGLNGTANCKKLTTIDCIRALYGVPVPARGQKPNPYNQMGIAEWADYLYLPDLKAFYKNFTKPRIPQSLEPEFISIDGGKRGDESRLKAGTVVESGLDFMTAMSIIYPQNTRLYQVGDGVNIDSVGTFNIFLDALDKSYCSYKGGDAPYIDPAYPDPNDGGYDGPLQCGGAPMSNVFSVSYGQIEGALPRFYQERQCEEWAKLALQGVSVLFASGDSGVANRYNAGYPDSCLDVKDKFVDPNGKRFSPSFPANCPYITAVGATTLLTNDIKDGERAVDRFGSGGGFSDIFVAPDYQKAAVSNYLKNYAPPYGDDIFNSSGRGFPDIAALGDTLATVINGTVHGVGGTSASAPLFAGIVTVLNEERLKNGRGPIGFLNPTIYKHPEIFNDVTVGDNPGCGTRGKFDHATHSLPLFWSFTNFHTQVSLLPRDGTPSLVWVRPTTRRCEPSSPSCHKQVHRYNFNECICYIFQTMPSQLLLRGRLLRCEQTLPPR